MLSYHAIAHDSCAERLAQVEADWRVVTTRDEQADPSAVGAASHWSPWRRPLATGVARTLRRLLGRRSLRPA